MLSVLAPGPAAPSVAVNASDVGATASAGGCGGATVSVTGIVFGDPVAPAAVTVTVAVYVPAPRPVVSAATVRSRGALPLAGATESHAASSDALKLSAPSPLLETVSVLDAGF